MDLDQLIIHHIISSGLEPIIDAGVNSKDIEGDANRRMFVYILDHFKNPRYKGTVPTLEMLRRQFPDWEPPRLKKPKEPLAWVLDEVRSRALYNYMADRMPAIGKALKKNDINGAAKIFAVAAAELASRMGVSKTTSITRTTEERKFSYQQRRDGVNLYGVPTGFRWFDEVTLGWQEEDLILYLGKRGIGKSWAGMISAHAAQLSGYPPMIVSKEMSSKAWGMRYDALHAKLPYRAFRRGQLGSALEKQYYKSLVEMEKLTPFYLPHFEGPCCPLAIQAKARELKCRLVILDGVYMLDPNPGDPTSGWEKHAAIAAALKANCQADKIPTIMINQLSKNNTPDDADLDDSAYSDAFGQYSDVALKFMQSRDDRVSSEMRVAFLKIREEERPDGDHRLQWDFENMLFDSVEGQLEDSETAKVEPVKAEGITY